MATWFEVAIAGADAQLAEQVAERGLDEVARLEGLLSEWQPGSQISAINASAGGPPVKVAPEVMEVLSAGLEVSRWSEGAYDLSWAALRGLYRFHPGQRRIPDMAEVQAALRRVGHAGIELDTKAGTARLSTPGMAIGTGGIAKGYALDRVGAILRAEGIDNYMLFAGGQVQVHGLREGRPWRVGIRHPRVGTRYVGFFELSNGSVSTSGDYEHFFMADGKRWHHIIDLKTGLPARRSISVTLVAEKGVHADALSTACFVLGPDRCQAMLAKQERRADVALIAPDFSVHVNAGSDARLRFTPPLLGGKIAP